MRTSIEHFVNTRLASMGDSLQKFAANSDYSIQAVKKVLRGQRSSPRISVIWRFTLITRTGRSLRKTVQKKLGRPGGRSMNIQKSPALAGEARYCRIPWASIYTIKPFRSSMRTGFFPPPF